ncbi:MAG: phosphotransferase [Actinomycetaceae bacterium]|nr:phosphotransferase [Actinomycetaceae bacterium]
MSASWPPDVDMLDVIGDWLYSQRWFPGSVGDSVRLVANLDLSALSGPTDTHPDDVDVLEPVWISIIEVGETFIQVPLAYTDVKPDYGVVAQVRDAWIVDGAYSPAFLRAWLRKAHATGTLYPIDPTRADEVLDELLSHVEQSQVLTGEQSNTSVLFDCQYACVLKILRVLHAGDHPELEITTALAHAGWKHIAAPIAYLEERLSVPELSRSPVLLGIAGSLVRGARDGFDLFVDLASRDEDPAPLARELGAVTAGLHQHLAQALGTFDAPTPEALHTRLLVNLAASAAEVPQLRESVLIERLESVIDRIQHLDELPATIRIHGDYHLGQTLYGEGGWFILDFEGEPLRPLSERSKPDLALRDVAGMLRSFDYAAAKGSASSWWVNSARSAFIAGYTNDGGFGEVEDELIRALEIEKTAYEAVYEYRLRPDWISIPLSALDRLAH